MMLNQFPCENLLTVKDCLASIARRAGGPEGPAWLPRTFNLRTELPQFISYFQQRETTPSKAPVAPTPDHPAIPVGLACPMASACCVPAAGLDGTSSGGSSLGLGQLLATNAQP